MKKKLLCSALLVACLTVSACGSASDTGNAAQNDSAESEEVSVDETESEETVEPEEETVREVKYLLSRYTFESSYYTGAIDVEYDENGKEVRELSYDADGNLDGETTVNRVGDNGEVLDYEYVSYDRDGNVTGRTVRTFSEDCSSVEVLYYDQEGALDRRYVSEYDEHGNVISDYGYDSDGNEIQHTEYHREYDDEGRQVLQADESNYVESEKYTGYIYYIVSEYEDGKSYSTNYEADYIAHISSGNTVFEYLGTVSPTYWSYTEYEYDEFGNKIKETSYSKYAEDAEWELSATTVYEYIPFEVK